MEADRVVVDELVLRLPGMTPEAARGLAADVAQRVGRGLAEAQPHASLGRLDLRITPPPSLSPDRQAEWIAQRILESVLR